MEEKDIKIIEDYIDNWRDSITDEDGYTKEKLDEDSEEFIETIENILIDYKQKLSALDKNEDLIRQLGKEIDRLQKENIELKEENMEKSLEIIGKEEYVKASMQEIIENYYTANEDCVKKSVIQDKIYELKSCDTSCLVEQIYNNGKIALCKELLEKER